MTIYAIALFLHIVGALGLFVALGLEWTSLRQLRRATTAEQVHEWLRVSAGGRRVGMPSMLIVLVSGFYMMAMVWGGVAWIVVALGALVLVVILGLVVTGPRMAVMRRAAAIERGALTPTFRQRRHDRLLWTSIQTRIAIALGIVFLMTVKPGLEGALLTLGVAIILGLASAWSIGGRNQAKEPAV